MLWKMSGRSHWQVMSRKMMLSDFRYGIDIFRSLKISLNFKRNTTLMKCKSSNKENNTYLKDIGKKKKIVFPAGKLLQKLLLLGLGNTVFGFSKLCCWKTFLFPTFCCIPPHFTFEPSELLSLLAIASVFICCNFFLYYWQYTKKSDQLFSPTLFLLLSICLLVLIPYH